MQHEETEINKQTDLIAQVSQVWYHGGVAHLLLLSGIHGWK